MVPNPALRSEYAWNVEAGMVREMTNRFKFEATVFFTKLNHAIVRRPFELNGSDSIDFQGDRLAVEALQNTAFAQVWGVQAAIEARIFKKIVLQSQANLIKGSETDDFTNGQVPLRHAPPFYGQTNVRYRSKRIWMELSVVYNAIVRNKDLPPSEQAKDDIYARDVDGNPFSPGWHTLNFRSSYQLSEGLSITAAWENFTNQRYRPFSSGIVSSGSNLIFAVKKTF
jgi:hemoglobin/transferrin/lactoferrin receptor protein